MLAELAAANAAFAVIKTAIQNGKELHETGKATFDYFDNKNKLQKNFQKKGRRTDLEEFLALEKIKEQEELLREIMIYTGRPGLWDDWLQFQADAKKERVRQEKLRLQKIQRTKEITGLIVGTILIAVMALGGIVVGLSLLF